MSNLSKSKLGKFAVTIFALSSISAILTTAQKAEAFPTNTIMQPGSSITSNNQCFSLNAQTDGNLVLYRRSNGQALWHTGTYGKNVKQTIFQTDGNLVIYNTSNSPVWASNTERRGAAQIYVQDDGNVVMYNSQNQAIWHTNTVTSCGNSTPTPASPTNPLINNMIMQPGSSIISNNQCFSLNAQTDGNLVLYRKSNGQALWHTGTYGKNVKQTIFQNDGNLVIYNTSNSPVWASNTERRGATKLTVQDDGNVVIYTPQGQAVWHTNTVTSCTNQPPISNIGYILPFQAGYKARLDQALGAKTVSGTGITHGPTPLAIDLTVIAQEYRDSSGLYYSTAQARAIAAGQVIQSSYQGVYGNTVVIRHDDGNTSQYSHLHNYAVQNGQRVNAGQNLGVIGMTASNAAIGKNNVHLHFEMKDRNGKYITFQFRDAAGVNFYQPGIEVTAQNP